MDRNELYTKLINKYGIIQLAVAIEELSELQKELCKSLRDKTNIDNIIEEMADVIIMLDQVKIFFKINESDIQNKIEEKNDRTKRLLL